MPTAKRDLIVLILGRVLQVIALFLSYKLLVSYLDKSQVGFYLWTLSITLWFGLVFINPIGVYFNRQLHIWVRDNKLKRSVLAFSGFSFFISVLCFFVFYFLSHSLTDINVSWGVSAVVAFYMLATVTANTFIPSLNILKQRVTFVVLTVLSQFLGLGLSVFFVLKYGLNSSFWLLGLGAGLGVFSVIAAFLLVRTPQDEDSSGGRKGLEFNLGSDSFGLPTFLSREQIKRIFGFAAPLALTNICLWIMTQFYRQTTEYFEGLEFLAIAGFGLTLAAQLSITLEYLVQQFFFPEFYEKIGSDSRSEREKSWNNYAVQVIPIFISFAVMVSVCAPFIVPVFGKGDYSGAIFFLTVGIWAETLRAINNVFTLIGQSEMTTKKGIPPYIVGGVITFALLIGVGWIEASAMALPYVLVVGHALVLFLLWKAFSKDFSVNIDPLKWFKILWHLPIYLLVIPFYSHSDSILFSLGALIFCGIVFSYFQYKGLFSDKNFQRVMKS